MDPGSIQRFALFKKVWIWVFNDLFMKKSLMLDSSAFNRDWCSMASSLGRWNRPKKVFSLITVYTRV